MVCCMMKEGKLGFKTCQFVQNYVILTNSLLVLCVVCYTLCAIYLVQPTGKQDESGPGLVEDYAFLVENEMDEMRYHRFRTALGNTDPGVNSRRQEEPKDLLNNNSGQMPDKRNESGTGSNARRKCVQCVHTVPGEIKYYQLITTDKLYMAVYVSAILGMLLLGFCLARALYFKRWLEVK